MILLPSGLAQISGSGPSRNPRRLEVAVGDRLQLDGSNLRPEANHGRLADGREHLGRLAWKRHWSFTGVENGSPTLLSEQIVLTQ